MSSIAERMKGGFELVLLFGSGVQKFTGTKAAALQSLLIPAVMLPVMMALSAYYPPKGMETGFETPQIVMNAAFHFVVSFILCMVLIAAIASWMKKPERFWHAFEAGNWASLILSLFILPFTVFALLYPEQREQMDRIFVLFTCYGYIVTGCVIYRTLKLNWELAGATAIGTLFINQELWNLMYWMQGIPDPWG